MTWQFYLVAIAAVTLVGLSKGGFSGLSLLSIPLLALVVSPIRAAAIMLPILIVQDLVSVWAYRKSFDRRIITIMIPGGILGIAIAAITAAYVTDAIVVLGVGLIASCFVLYTWLSKAGSDATPRQGSVPRGIFWAACAGFTSFIANAGTPPFQVYVLPQRLSPQVYAGTQTMVFAAINWLKVGAFFALGQVSMENFGVSARLFPLAIAATFAGIWLVRRVSGRAFYRIIYVFTFCVGLKLIFDGARGLIGS
ncbi:MAG: sulfite exporter TauE/SafE family protein [Beijerinckiaceae bacterium]